MAQNHAETSRLNVSDHSRLVAALGDTPETVIAVHLLHRNLARAYVAGQPDQFDAAIIENLAFDQDELTGFGTAGPLWDLLKRMDGWSCIEVDPSVAAELSGQIATAIGRRVRTLQDIYHVLRHPVSLPSAETVRLLTPIDSVLLERAPQELRGDGWGSTRALLRDGVAAAAIVGGEVVALAHTAARSNHHADLSVATLPAWRGRGLASATAALVAREVQTFGQTPVWSTGVTNAASLRIARKLGFVAVARRTYLIK